MARNPFSNAKHMANWIRNNPADHLRQLEGRAAYHAELAT